MILQASHIGELAAEFLARGGRGKVTRVFSTSAYLRLGDDFMLVLDGRLKSPMTINLDGGGKRLSGFEPGGEWEVAPRGFKSGPADVSVADAVLYRSALHGRTSATLPSAAELVKGVTMLRSLYDVAQSGPTLADDDALGGFAGSTLTPFANGDEDIHDRTHYLPLIGRGGGFTPSGDDFVAGFLASFNHMARSSGSRPVTLPKALLYQNTVPESAAIVFYATLGYVDEELARLILASLDARATGFQSELLDVARRGHTSGIDMSLGVLLCEAALSDASGRSALKACMRALWNR